MEDLGAKAIGSNLVIAYYLFFWSNGIQLINKDNCRNILLCVFKSYRWRQKCKVDINFCRSVQLIGNVDVLV